MLSFLPVRKCYHFCVIIFPCTGWVFSLMLSFNVIIYCYHFHHFFLFPENVTHSTNSVFHGTANTKAVFFSARDPRTDLSCGADISGGLSWHYWYYFLFFFITLTITFFSLLCTIVRIQLEEKIIQVFKYVLFFVVLKLKSSMVILIPLLKIKKKPQHFFSWQ